MPPRHSVVALVIASGAALIGAGDAAATERFAKPGGTAGADCLTEATACALGKAVQDTPNNISVFGANTVTMLPGDYTEQDVVDGDPGSAPGELNLKTGMVLRGKPGGAKPTFTFGPTNDLLHAVKVRSAVLRDLIVRRTGSTGVTLKAEGSVAFGSVPDLPGILDRVVVEAGADGFGVQLVGLSTISNSLVRQTGGTTGAGIDVAPDPQRTPRIVASTILSDGTAASVLYGNSSSASRVDFVNTALRGATDLDFGTTSPTPTGQTTVAAQGSAFRLPTATPTGTSVTGAPIAFDPATLDATGAPTASSALIDKGVVAPDLGAVDLIGKTRISGTAPDIGAYEFEALAPTPTPTPTPTPAATPTPTPGTPTAGPDKTAPKLGVVGSLKSTKRSKLSSKKGITFSCTLDESATVVVELVVPGKKPKKGKKPTEKVLGTGTAKATAAGTVVLTLKIKASKLGTGKRKATLRFTAKDGAGNTTVVTKATTVG